MSRLSVRRRAVAIGAVCVAALGAVACNAPSEGSATAADGAAAEAGPAIASRSVRIVRPRRLLGAVARWPAESVATAAHEAAVATPVAGRVEAVLHSPGDVVAQGEALLRLRSPERAAAVAAERAARRQLDVVRRRLAQVSRQQQMGLLLADARYALERDAAGLEAEAARAAATLAATHDPACDGPEPRDAALLVLCAPQAGVVAEAHARVGENVGPGTDALMTLRTRAPGRVRLQRFGPAPAGVQLRFEAAGRSVPLAADAVSELVDPRTGAVSAFHLPEPATVLDAGLRGDVVGTLDGATAEVFALPRTAVAQRAGALVAFRVVGSGAPQAVPVRVLGGDAAEVWVRPAAGDAPLRLGDAVLAVAPPIEGGGGED